MQQICTSYKLGQELTMVGTKNRSELPPQLLPTKNRPLHRDGRICGLEHQKPEIIMDYNATKGGVDNMDKLVSAYSFKRRTLRWPLAIFFNILDIPAYNAFITWMALNPEWKRGKLQRIRLFLEELGKTLVKP